MEAGNTNNSFKYTYSAEEQEEIKKIRQKYLTQEEDGMGKVRKLDKKASQKATGVSLVLGVMGALALGSGMSLIMTDIGRLLGLTGMAGTITGLLTGVVGIILIILAYPVYRTVLKKEREKIAPEIMRLTEELLI